eukprot:TRINITY_DN12497_c0_g1_i1.p1 TRINITY_DN12497_c0_g1~~TRINITY_DN12497_c0_g1_i1.p1  ORF type:complete len:129 (+),score=37.54 TRINITY_DN12497_c0_g1_i1:126-512(+)
MDSSPKDDTGRASSATGSPHATSSSSPFTSSPLKKRVIRPGDIGWGVQRPETSSSPTHGIVEGVGREGARREIEARFLKLPCTTMNYTLKQFKPISTGRSSTGGAWDARSESSSRCSSSTSSKSGKVV